MLLKRRGFCLKKLGVKKMKTEINRIDPPFGIEQGTPFLPVDEGRNAAVRFRVMPSQYDFPELPIACTFIRQLNPDI